MIDEMDGCGGRRPASERGEEEEEEERGWYVLQK
jgi:hypothetical protein